MAVHIPVQKSPDMAQTVDETQGPIRALLDRPVLDYRPIESWAARSGPSRDMCFIPNLGFPIRP